MSVILTYGTQAYSEYMTTHVTLSVYCHCHMCINIYSKQTMGDYAIGSNQMYIYRFIAESYKVWDTLDSGDLVRALLPTRPWELCLRRHTHTSISLGKVTVPLWRENNCMYLEWDCGEKKCYRNLSSPKSQVLVMFLVSYGRKLETTDVRWHGWCLGPV